MKSIIRIIITLIIAVLCLGCYAYGADEKTSVNQKANACARLVDYVSSDNRDEEGNLYYGTSDYPEGRREEMEAQYALLNYGG